MLFKLVGVPILFALTFFFGGCSAGSTSILQANNVAPETKTLAVPPQIKFDETPRFKELKKQFEAAESEVKQLEEQRLRLLVNYTEDYPKVKKITKELEKAREKLKVIENLLNVEREKLDIQVKTPPV
jgi:spore coat polysaccharide biosynthesis protein SpsF (cytidylyltransferase family)